MPPKVFTGTWEEVAQHAAEFAGQQVRLIVLSEQDAKEPDAPTQNAGSKLDAAIIAELLAEARRVAAQPGEPQRDSHEQEERDAKAAQFFARLDAMERTPGKPLTDPYEAAWGAGVEEKARKQGFII